MGVQVAGAGNREAREATETPATEIVGTTAGTVEHSWEGCVRNSRRRWVPLINPYKIHKGEECSLVSFLLGERGGYFPVSAPLISRPQLEHGIPHCLKSISKEFWWA